MIPSSTRCRTSRNATCSLHVELLEPRLPLSASTLGDGGADFQDVIVRLASNGSDAGTLGREVAAAHGGGIGHVYQSVPGFAASLPQAAIAALQKNPNVASIELDSLAFLQAQTLPTGINRIEADQNPRAAIDGITGNANGGGFPFLVATIDSGIDLEHPDLNVAGGRNFIRGANDTKIDDGNGHGTHVAGTMAALDNTEGVVGAAPGAGVWAAKAFGNNGSGEISNILAAMDHILQERQAGSPIAVVNMSYRTSAIGGNRPMEEAFLEQMGNLGIIAVAAAGNFGGSGSTFPAADPHTISVAALADSDGQPGGNGSDTSHGPDDTIAEFSNCCSRVDLAAPGVDILSTWSKGSGYDVLSGTSMAAPHVSGAAALFIAQYAAAWTAGLPADLLDTVVVREALTQTAAVSGQFVVRQDDPTRGTYVLQADGDWTTPPVVSITSDVPSALQGPVSLRADARDVDTSLGDLRFEIRFVDSGGAATSVSPTSTYFAANADYPYGYYELSWDSSAAGVPEGHYELIVVAIDGEGNESNAHARLTTNGHSVYVDDGVNDPPTVNITSPIAGGGDLSGTVALQADVTDDGTVASVSFTVTDEGGTQIAQLAASETTAATATTPAVWTAFWDTTAVDNGNYSISVVATDTLGAQSGPDTEGPIVVDNAPTTEGSLAVSDLDGFTQQENKKRWTAVARVQVQDTAGNPVPNAVVYGDWLTAGGSMATTWSPTDADGWIEHRFIRLSEFSFPVRYTIDRVEHPDLIYQPLLNSDPDGDSEISESGEMSIRISRDTTAAAISHTSDSSTSGVVQSPQKKADATPVAAKTDQRQPAADSTPSNSITDVLRKRRSAADHLFATAADWTISPLADELVSSLST